MIPSLITPDVASSKLQFDCTAFTGYLVQQSINCPQLRYVVTVDDPLLSPSIKHQAYQQTPTSSKKSTDVVHVNTTTTPMNSRHEAIQFSLQALYPKKKKFFKNRRSTPYKITRQANNHFETITIKTHTWNPTTALDDFLEYDDYCEFLTKILCEKPFQMAQTLEKAMEQFLPDDNPQLTSSSRCV